MIRITITLFAILMLCSGCSQEPVKEKAENAKLEKKQAEPVLKSDHKAVVPEPKYRLNEANWTIEPINEQTGTKVVLFTIDDAPDHHALEMAKKLKKLNIPAIFFVNGHLLETNQQKQTLRRIHDMGFVIGNHTYSHRSLTELTEDEQKDEILQVNRMVEELIGEKPSFFRAPFGQNTSFTKKLAKQEDMTLMNWTYGYDWNKAYMNKEGLERIMVEAPELTDGANLLMHDREWTNEALEGIVKGLKEKGYSFVDPKQIEGYHGKQTE